MSSSSATLMIASSEADANLYYATHFLVPDPVVYFEIGGKKHLVLSDLEIDRAKTQASVHHLISLSDVFGEMKTTYKNKKKLTGYGAVVDYLFKKKGIKNITIPANFPSQYFVMLKKSGYAVEIKPDPFFEQRLVKTAEEKKHIRNSIIQVEHTLKEALQFLEKAKIKGNKIYSGKQVVTSEFMQSFINARLMERRCVAHHTIVASGSQGSLPHHHGSGPLKAHTPIIFDIFPKHQETQYFADMTRTIVKGKPSDTVKKMYKAVLEANLRAQEKVRAGVTGSAIHQIAVDVLKKHGFETGKRNGRMQGYIHSTGHGLGLDVHEAPSVSQMGGPLKAGNVVTIEPGLYYEEHGGIRLEDDLFVTKTGSETLTKFPKFLELDRANL